MPEPANKNHRAYRDAERFGLTPRRAALMRAEGRLPPETEDPSIEYFTTDRVAGILGVNPKTVRNWVLRGELVGTRLGRNTLRIRRPDLEAFLARRREVGGGR